VIDVIGASLAAVAGRTSIAYPLVFAAGISTSIGPCVAPRYVAVTALASTSRRPFGVAMLFLAGVVGAYVVLGLVFGAVGTLWWSSHVIYAGLATALGLGGIVTLLREAPRCEHRRAAPRRASAGGPFLVGASSAFVVSPCCTPIVAAIAGFTTLGGHVAAGVGLLVAFALGHAAPLLAVGVVGRGFAGLGRHASLATVPSIVAGTLMLALAVYYGVLA
jgi:cytochrome c biogenesis protein CcdA